MYTQRTVVKLFYPSLSKALKQASIMVPAARSSNRQQVVYLAWMMCASTALQISRSSLSRGPRDRVEMSNVYIYRGRDAACLGTAAASTERTRRRREHPNGAPLRTYSYCVCL